MKLDHHRVTSYHNKLMEAANCSVARAIYMLGICDGANLVVKRLTITRKDGLFAGSVCAQAFMIRPIIGG